MVCDWNGAAVDNLLGCMETDDDDGEEGEAVPKGTADVAATGSGDDGLTVVVWICKLLGRKLLSFEGGKVPGELVCGKQVGLTDNVIVGADDIGRTEGFRTGIVVGYLDEIVGTFVGIVGPEVVSFDGKVLGFEVIVVG